MTKIKIFISSVQSEFAYERAELYEYMLSDALLGRFFEPFLFELLPATDLTVSKVYLREVEQCAIYISLFGTQYGYEDTEGSSATEREYDHATTHHKIMPLAHVPKAHQYRATTKFPKKLYQKLS